MSIGYGKKQVTNGDGKGEMDEVRDNTSYTIVVDILMGTWGTYREHYN